MRTAAYPDHSGAISSSAHRPHFTSFNIFPSRSTSASHPLKQRKPAVGPVHIAASIREKIAAIDASNLGRHVKFLLATD